MDDPMGLQSPTAGPKERDLWGSRSQARAPSFFRIYFPTRGTSAQHIVGLFSFVFPAGLSQTHLQPDERRSANESLEEVEN